MSGATTTQIALGHVAPPNRVRVDLAHATDPGLDPNKQINEDAVSFVATPLGHLCVLCDGMGGHHGGREASHTAIATVLEVVQRAQPGTQPAVALKYAIEEAGRRVFAIGGDPANRARPGSTVVAMLVHDRGLDVAHVGDSRAYVIRANQIYPLTRDHSMVQSMIDSGMLTEQQAIGHPDSNKITRALGMRPDVEVEVRPESMELFEGDLLLLASDGLTDLALGPDILRATLQGLNAGGDLAHTCVSLVAMANSRGGHDNITVLLARIADTGPKVSHTIPQAPTPTYGGPGAGPTFAPADASPASLRHAPQPAVTRPQTRTPTLGGTLPMHGSQGLLASEAARDAHARYAPTAPPSNAGMNGAPAPAPTWGGATPPQTPAVTAARNALPGPAPAHSPAPAYGAGPTMTEGRAPQPSPTLAPDPGLGPGPAYGQQAFAGAMAPQPYAEARSSRGVVLAIVGIACLIATVILLVLWATLAR